MKASVAERKEERVATELTLRLESGAEGRVRNVSATGIYFLTDAPLTEGQTLKFTLEFRDFPSGPLQVNCRARVLRVERQGSGNGVAASISSFEFQRVGFKERYARGN